MFGPEGFFPDAATKALYWIDGKVPEQFSQALFNYFGYSKDATQDQVCIFLVFFLLLKFTNKH